MVFDPEVTTAGLLAIQGVNAHDLRKFDEIGNSTGFFQLCVDAIGVSRNANIFPELFTNLRYAPESFLEAFLAAGHAAFFPYK